MVGGSNPSGRANPYLAFCHRPSGDPSSDGAGATLAGVGAVQWGVMEDTAQPGAWLEYFVVGSWLEHLRQHERVTQDERRLQESLLALLSPGATPHVRHFLGGAPVPAVPDLPHNHADA